MTIEDHGWGNDGPCPSWCVRGSDHLLSQLDRGPGDYWHEGKRYEFATSGEDYNGHPITITVSLMQHVQVDERGYYRHPVRVNFWGQDLTRRQALELSEAIAQLAEQAQEGDR